MFNLSLCTRLTRVKRLSHKRCCDTKPDRCQEGSRLTILLRIHKMYLALGNWNFYQRKTKITMKQQ
eukprot:UN12265